MAKEIRIHKVDDLMKIAKQYTQCSNYMQMIDFCCQMKHLGPYNAMLAWFQRPDASLLLTSAEWLSHGCMVKESVHPLLIFLPFSPVEFLFDQADVDILNPPLIGGGQDYFDHIRNQMSSQLSQCINKLHSNAIANMNLDGIAVVTSDEESPNNEIIHVTRTDDKHKVKIPMSGASKPIESRAFYYIQLEKQSIDAQLNTMITQLARLYCHHLPSPDGKDWTIRHLNANAMDFEAKSVVKLVADHFGIMSPASDYLKSYASTHTYIPQSVSIDTIMSAAGRIIQMLSNSRLPFRNGLLFRLSKEFQTKVTRLDNKKRRIAATTSTLQEYPVIPGFE